MADRDRIETLQNQVITLATKRDDARAKLKEAALQLYEIRLSAEAEPDHRIMMDAVRTTLDECVKLLS